MLEILFNFATKKMKQFLYSIIFLMFSIFIFAQNIYEESRYQLMINYKLNDRYSLSFQPEMRVNNFTEKTTITLWRLLFIRKSHGIIFLNQKTC